MGEVGDPLRDARRQRELELSQCEQATKIRAKYLMALEEDRFEVLPEPVFVRAMLRTYADYLGVDSDPLVEAYSAAHPEAPPPPDRTTPRHTTFVSRRRSGRRGQRGRGPDPRLVAFALGILLVIGGLVWLGRHNPKRIDPTPTLSTEVGARAPEVRTVPVVSGARRTPPVPEPVFLVILADSATPADIQIRRVDAEGPTVFAGTLSQGSRRRVRVDGLLWVHLAPGGGTVAARLAGKRVALPTGDAGTVVGPKGVVG